MHILLGRLISNGFIEMWPRGGENVIHNFRFDFMPSPAITAQDSSLSEHTSDTHTGHSDGLLY